MTTNRGDMRRVREALLSILLSVALAGCSSNEVVAVGDAPAPPESFEAFYYAGAVELSWALGPAWNGEPFRIWGRRVSDSQFFLVAEVTSCAEGLCSYSDTNVAPNVTYVYFITAVSRSGVETASDDRIEVFVPDPISPAAPGNVDVIPLDGALYLTWDDTSRLADDFSFYRVYFDSGEGSIFLLGETDSEGFLDSRVENGSTYAYFVTALDDLGHESAGTALVEGTPRPDFHGELLFAFSDQPDLSGFRFQDTDSTNPILPGNDPNRDFRLEFDGQRWWLAPGPGVEVADESFFTTALRCGPAADPGCLDVRWAPQTGYSSAATELATEFSFAIRVPVTGGWNYGLVRVTHLGFAQDGAIAIFDWAFQLQTDNPSLLTGKS